MGEITINYATARKFLLATGLRASKESIVKMQDAVKVYAEGIATKAGEAAKVDNNKTILNKHIEAVLQISAV